MSFYQRNNMKKIEVLNVKKYFGNLKTLEDISLYLEENQFVSILGPSGSGKSTLFNIISGLIKPDEGKIIIEGKNYIGKTGRVSYMHQKDLLLPWKTIIENVCIPLILKGYTKKDAGDKAKKYFDLFGLEGFENHYPSQLSGGMRQRAALLRTYLFSNDIMLLDEPFGGLDAITKRNMQHWLLSVLENLKSSILFITHDIDEAIFLSDKIYILSERPAKVKEVVCVDIERPRDNRTFVSEKFNELKENILNLL
ncbi:ABC transporter ATP-binding protein [Crassaminicella thermophila]|uniref:ABC transporter ATP-binding protein n=1 Tax=Crassaminicella thermophila TaxID=2599308 RepID=A0A5C0SEC9_CRATE|nr:ABC transporter ATP-binding protein [Crassaminicella thermophila]QEK12520.1 ABC transporter ATP-binding protein [Crassaminicella thermophila]